jgi:hypothetical protein
MSLQEIDAIWERYKPTLWGLWVRDRKPLSKVQEEMLAMDFVAEPDEYKKRFKAWGFSQYIPADVWKHVGHRVEKRKREGLESAVVLDGVLVQNKRLRKETSRHYFNTSELLNISQSSNFKERFLS